jgi:N-acetylmuramoyl-L-alanine amidase
MKKRVSVLAALLLLSLPASGGKPTADELYESARTSYYALKADPARRKFRHHWLNVARKFEQVSSRWPKSERAPDALFTAADLLAELSRFSGDAADLEGAVLDYQKLLDDHPRHRLADDASLALAHIQVDRSGDVEAGRKTLNRALEGGRKGDQVRALKAYLASLPPSAAGQEKAEPSHKAPAFPALGGASQPEAQIAAANPSPVESPKRPAAKALAPPEPTASGDALAEAISRAARSARLESKIAAEPDPLERIILPKLSDVQARLRDVRVGTVEPEAPPAVAKVDDRTAKERLQKVAKVERRHDEITLAEQLGLKVRRVVIDAGHGGPDTGAIGPGGTLEKDVALAIAKKLSEQLSDAGLEVILTRDDDTFVRLEDRAKLANEAHGDLFISVHCNSAPSKKLRGIETYTLNTSADRYSIRLAARENSSSEKGISDLQFILADLATKANTEESSRLAQRVQRGLVGSLKPKYKEVRDLGNKEALFYVLLGARMPAILVETSFLSNPAEEKLLGSAAYQDDVAAAIAAGVQEFLGNRQRLAKVD